MESVKTDNLSTNYPLGQEKEESAKLLFQFFCNNLQLGQWEVAGACLTQLAQTADYRQRTKDVLKAVIENPYGKSHLGDGIQSPHHLSWLCLLEYRKLFTDETEDAELKFLTADVEFRLLLNEFSHQASANVIKELYLYHRHLWKAKNSQSSPSLRDGPKYLSPAALSLLRSALENKPSTCHSIITAIKAPEKGCYRLQNEALDKIYVDSMLHLLERISEAQAEDKTGWGEHDHSFKGDRSNSPGIQEGGVCEGDSHTLPQNESESETDSCHGLLLKFYNILSLFDPGPDPNSKFLTTFLTKLVERCWTAESSLNKHQVLSCLVGRSSTHLVTEFTRLDEEFTVEQIKVKCGTKEHSQNTSADLLTLSLCRSREKAWRLVLNKIIEHKQHFLDQVLQTALRYIETQRFADLDRLLSPEELHPLKPLVVLMGWNHCYSSSHARTLLSILSDQYDGKTCSLEVCCSKLSNQVDLIEWCLLKARPTDTTKISHSSEKATELFRSLESHSVLYVLHHAAKLSALDETEVLSLLEKTPNHTETMNGCANKRIVRFADEDNSPGELTGNQPISLEQERDMSIYRSYCALKNVMDAIKTCLDYAHLDPMNPIQKQLRRKSSGSSTCSKRSSSFGDFSSPSMTSTLTAGHDLDRYDGSDFQEFYQQNVWSRLEAAKSHLAEIFPLTLRLEILENLFSLLFVTHEDIQENPLSESDGEEAAVEETKGFGSSFDSFNLSTLSEDESRKFKRPQSSVSRDSYKPQSVGMDFDEPFESVYVKSSRGDLNSESSVDSRIQSRENSVEDANLQKLLPLRLKDDLQIKRSNSLSVEKGDSGQQISGTSTQSNSSSKSLFKLGFMSNEYMVRDLLQILRDCLFDFDTTKFRLAGKDCEANTVDKKQPQIRIDSETEGKLTKVVPCSVAPEALQKRTSRLTQFVSEAQWRFQLVAHPDIPKQPGQVLTEALQQQLNSSDEENLVDTEMNEGKKRKKRIPKLGEKLSAETAGGETTGSQHTDGGYDSSRQRRPRSSSRRKSLGTAKVTKLHTGIVPTMLASPESLLSLCLKRNLTAQANQVVKMFSMDGRPEVLEVTFCAKYADAVKKLQSFGSKSAREVGTNSSAAGRISMKMLANVAAAGMATASVSNITDDLLGSASLPVLPSPTKGDNVPNQVKEYFNQETIPCLILGDLSVTTCRSWDLCSSLLEIAKNLQVTPEVRVSGKPDIKTVDKNVSSRDFKPTGTALFLDQIRELVQFAINCQSPETATADQILTGTFLGSNPEVCLRLSLHPLHVAGCRNLLAAVEILRKTAAKAQSVIVERAASPRLQRQKSSPDSSLSLRRASPQSYSKQEQPVIHNAMKHLIHALEKHVPAGGFIRHFIRGTSETSPASRNYLLSLYDHVKELAFLVAECEAKTKDLMVVPTNYFRMLEEGPISTLGRLMFVKKMQPGRLEKVAEKLSLNLTHIIVRSCCARVPSKHVRPLLPPQISQPVVLADGRTVLNGSVLNWTGVPRHPEVVARNLLTRLVQFIRDAAQRHNARGIFTPSCAEVTCQTVEYQDIAQATQELKFVRLTELSSREEKICFFSNLQNLLAVHAHLYSALKRLNQRHPDEDPSVMGKVLESCSLAYHIGELGVVSLFELRFVINRCGLHPPSMWKKLLQQRLCPLDPLDPWFTFTPPPEPRLLFVTTDCSASSPPILILSPDMVQSQLHRAMKDFLNQTVAISLPHKQVTIPELLVWYRRDFSSEKVDQFDAPNEGLVNFISTQVTGSTESDLIQLLQLDQVHEFGENIDSTGRKELPFTVKVQAFDHNCQINFDYETLKKASHPLKKAHRRSYSSPPSLESSEDLSFDKTKEPTTFQMTPITLEYIKEDSPLCATLVSLICSDELDDIEEHLEDDYFSDSPPRLRKRTQSDISLVDIRSYRYHRLTDDYPILKRHLLNLVVPLAAAEDPDILKSGDPILKFVTSSISDKVKGCMLNLHGNREYQSCLAAILNELFVACDWQAILNILTCIPKMHLDASPQLKIFSDFVVCCRVISLSQKSPVCSLVETETMSRSIRVCHSASQQASIALSVCRFLSLEGAFNLIQFCLSNNNTADMTRALSSKLAELNIYAKITACAKSQTELSLNNTDPVLQISDETVKDLSQLKQFLDWRTVQKSRPIDVLSLLIKAGDFDTARAWAALHDIADTKHQEIEEKYILSLLSQSPPNTTKAFKSLEVMLSEDADLCYLSCQRLLSDVSQTGNILFLTNFILSHLADKMSDLKLDQHRCLNMGAKALLCLPEQIRGEYDHLITAPILLLEQLLMNMKADLACQVFQRIKYDFSRVKDTNLKFHIDNFDDLLVKYGTKAIEFPVVQVQTEDRSQSLARSSPDGENVLPKSAFMESMRGGSSRKSVDYSALNVNRSLISSSLGASPNKRERVAAFSPPSKAMEGKFVMPADPPPKDKWVPDSSVSICMVCQMERFSMFNRRHHCRRCGRVVCAMCSSKTSVIRGVSARTCDQCYEQMFKPRLEKIKDDFDPYQQRMRDSLSTSVSPLNRAPPASSASSTASVGQELSAPVGDISTVIRHTEHEWKLKTEEEFNLYVREEFYYEQAPSASLCISILSMLSSRSKAGHVMLELCDELSKMLRPIAPGVPNPEVDYSLVTSMMKHLLFQAKMNYIERGESQGLVICDTYLSRVELLNLLVSGNVSDIPSIHELTKVESVRRLRDRLIEDERLLLAMEVSTKCGLDTGGVWAAWGMACLHCADYPGAREKFARCLKAPVDRNKGQQSSKLLSEIIDCLETMPSTTNTDVRSILSSPGSIKSLTVMPPLRYIDESLLDKAQFEEAIYYLRTYGSNMAAVQFFRRHGYLMKATQYILDHKCSTEVFVDGLFMPSLTSEELGKLEDQLMLIDPSLEKWNSYLTATCRHLMKSKLLHVLYHVQIFMKDYIRAAMNCITYFYQRGARTYLDLAGRVRHLFQAQTHLNAYLDPSMWGSVRQPATPSNRPSWSDTNSAATSVRLTQTPQEVKRYLNSVILQIEVTKYMEKSITSKPPDGTAIAVIQSYLSGKDPPPTLFGNSQVRADVITMVLMVGEDLLTSFDLSMKIIREYRLSAVPILKHTAHEMAKFHDYPRIHQLLGLLKQTEFDDPQTVDEIVGTCIIILKDDPAEVKEVDGLIKLLRLDSNKINAMILVGKLKSAYLLAVKSERVEDVQRISGAAQRSGQTSVKNICDKWLTQRQKKT